MEAPLGRVKRQSEIVNAGVKTASVGLGGRVGGTTVALVEVGLGVEVSVGVDVDVAVLVTGAFTIGATAGLFIQLSAIKASRARMIKNKRSSVH
jgi:hypothetical protein